MSVPVPADRSLKSACVCCFLGTEGKGSCGSVKEEIPTQVQDSVDFADWCMDKLSRQEDGMELMADIVMFLCLFVILCPLARVHSSVPRKQLTGPQYSVVPYV